MATKPTRRQQQARDHFAEALHLIAEGARLDGGGRLGQDDLGEVARRVARASSAFGLEEIVVLALEKRGRALGLPGGAVELLTLMDSEVKPLEMLRVPDDEFRELVVRLEDELGEV